VNNLPVVKFAPDKQIANFADLLQDIAKNQDQPSTSFFAWINKEDMVRNAQKFIWGKVKIVLAPYDSEKCLYRIYECEESFTEEVPGNSVFGMVYNNN